MSFWVKNARFFKSQAQLAFNAKSLGIKEYGDIYSLI